MKILWILSVLIVTVLIGDGVAFPGRIRFGYRFAADYCTIPLTVYSYTRCKEDCFFYGQEEGRCIRGLCHCLNLWEDEVTVFKS